jgi:hypothetical protein
MITAARIGRAIHICLRTGPRTTWALNIEFRPFAIEFRHHI